MSKRKRERIFRMKEFEVCHERSANKVGVDGVIIGAWAQLPVEKEIPEKTYRPLRILDAGCGCGLISLMMAQRYPKAEITGIDIDPPAVEEARQNCLSSPWSDRIEILELDFRRVEDLGKFDLIVSNPPFFHSGADANLSSRMLARHADSLSPANLILRAPALLNPSGRLSLIAQAEDSDSLCNLGREHLLVLQRMENVYGHYHTIAKRVLLEFSLPPDGKDHRDIIGKEATVGNLYIESEPGVFTEDYIRLCSPFYIKF